MRRYTLAQILEATGGELSRQVSDLQIPLELERDSRNMPAENGIFIAIQGEQHDGHRFIQAAIDRGAFSAIVSRAWAADHPEVSIPLVVVDDPGAALLRWAAWQRQRLAAKVVGITGSVGKTSAKEAIASVLSQRFRVFKSPGNFNNEVGLPLSLLDCPDDAEIIVLEMGGAYKFGELALLADIAKPSVGVVTNVYPVHLERMGTIDNIARTKAELVEAIPEDGFVVLNNDDVRVRAMADHTKARVITFGAESPADVQITGFETHGLSGAQVSMVIGGQPVEFSIPLPGSPGISIATIAAAVGYGFGLATEEIRAGLQDSNTHIRLNLLEGPNGSQLIDDTYNASVPSVVAALDVLQQVSARRRIAVLGEMRELGSEAEAGHTAIGVHAGEIVDLLVTFGNLTDITLEVAQSQATLLGRTLTTVRYTPDQRAELISYLRDELKPGDIALLKGARGLEMETIVAAIQSQSSDQDRP